MFEIRDKKIKITRGDSASINVMLRLSSGLPYTMAEGDTLTFTVRKSVRDDILIQVVSDTNTIVLTPTETKQLIVGQCCFDIELRTVSGDVFTIVGLTEDITNMVVYPEVTI